MNIRFGLDQSRTKHSVSRKVLFLFLVLLFILLAGCSDRQDRSVGTDPFYCIQTTVPGFNRLGAAINDWVKTQKGKQISANRYENGSIVTEYEIPLEVGSFVLKLRRRERTRLTALSLSVRHYGSRDDYSRYVISVCKKYRDLTDNVISPNLDLTSEIKRQSAEKLLSNLSLPRKKPEAGEDTRFFGMK